MYSILNGVKLAPAWCDELMVLMCLMTHCIYLHYLASSGVKFLLAFVSSGCGDGMEKHA